jgi:hypothetical protein
MNTRRLSFLGGAVVAGVGVAALLLGLPGVEAEGGGGGAPAVVALHARDYSYQGVPSSLAAGEVRFSFTNDSKNEPHEMQLYRINDGVNESFDQILADDEAHEQQQQQPGQQGGQNGQTTSTTAQSPPPAPKMTFFASTGAGPGDTARMDLIGKLPAGRYGMVCYLPVNGDDANGPHYKKGMKAEFTVK